MFELNNDLKLVFKHGGSDKEYKFEFFGDKGVSDNMVRNLEPLFFKSSMEYPSLTTLEGLKEFLTNNYEGTEYEGTELEEILELFTDVENFLEQPHMVRNLRHLKMVVNNIHFKYLETLPEIDTMHDAVTEVDTDTFHIYFVLLAMTIYDDKYKKYRGQIGGLLEHSYDEIKEVMERFYTIYNVVKEPSTKKLKFYYNLENYPMNKDILQLITDKGTFYIPFVDEVKFYKHENKELVEVKESDVF